MTAFLAALGRIACVGDERLAQPARWSWPARTADRDARYALYHALEAEQRAVIDAPRAPSEAARILSLAQAAFGDLCGLLAGRRDDVLDRVPAEGEWSVRRTLAHAIAVERSYRASAGYARDRRPDEPLKLPDDRRPPPDPAHTAGSFGDILERFAEQRAETDATLAPLTDAQLALPTMWGSYEVDLRHRLHRFASHLAEHTGQIEKGLVALGDQGTDARRIARRIGYLRGLHERRSAASVLAALDAALAAKAEALAV